MAAPRRYISGQSQLVAGKRYAPMMSLPSSSLVPPWADIMSDDDTCSGSDMDTSSVVSFESFGDSSASSATDIQDHASISSGASVFSMSSSIRAQSFKYEYGRNLNNYSEVYQLPADGEELDRLG